MNKIILDNLSILLEQKKQEKDTFRIRAIQNAIRTIKGLDFEITSIEQVKGLPGIGKGMQDRIKEILESGELEQVSEEMDKFKVLELIGGITGFGPVKAKDLYDKGYRTVQQIEKDKEKLDLTNQQKIGLKYYSDFNERIPRSEITKFKRKLSSVIKTIDPKIEFEIVGSYRRGKKESGDIDVLFTHPENKSYLSEIIEKLPLLTDTISKGNLKYMGVGKIDDKYRRIDFLFIKKQEYFTALVYFTGSGEFNTEMRKIAKQKGWKLNEHGLYDENGKIITISSEKDIFDKLGMEYLNPKDR